MSKTSGIKKTILGISITIILALFIGYGIETFHPSPKYDDFCEMPANPEKLSGWEECNDRCNGLHEDNKTELNNCVNLCDRKERKKDLTNQTEYERCYERYATARNKYDHVFFIVAIILGLIAIIIGAIFLKIEPVGSGIMGGGVLTIIYGTLRYWGNLADIGRFLILGLVLAILIYLGYKKLNR